MSEEPKCLTNNQILNKIYLELNGHNPKCSMCHAKIGNISFPTVKKQTCEENKKLLKVECFYCDGFEGKFVSLQNFKGLYLHEYCLDELKNMNCNLCCYITKREQIRIEKHGGSDGCLRLLCCCFCFPIAALTGQHINL